MAFKDKIKDFFSSMTAKDWLIAILILIIVFLGITTFVYYGKYRNTANEVIIMNDSIYTYKNKYEEEYLAKNTYILKAEQLEEYNKELYNEYKSLKDHPVVITKTRIIARIDTVYADTKDIAEDSVQMRWNWSAHDSTYYYISGMSSIRKDMSDATTRIDEINIPLDMTLDVIDDGKQLAVISKTDNPYVSLTGTQSVVIDPLSSPTIKNTMKQKRWAFGPTLTAGAGYGYDPIRKQSVFMVGGMIGFSITYILVQW